MAVISENMCTVLRKPNSDIGPSSARMRYTREYGETQTCPLGAQGLQRLHRVSRGGRAPQVGRTGALRAQQVRSLARAAARTRVLAEWPQSDLRHTKTRAPHTNQFSLINISRTKSRSQQNQGSNDAGHREEQLDTNLSQRIGPGEEPGGKKNQFLACTKSVRPRGLGLLDTVFNW